VNGTVGLLLPLVHKAREEENFPLLLFPLCPYLKTLHNPYPHIPTIIMKQREGSHALGRLHRAMP